MTLSVNLVLLFRRFISFSFSIDIRIFCLECKFAVFKPISCCSITLLTVNVCLKKILKVFINEFLNRLKEKTSSKRKQKDW